MPLFSSRENWRFWSFHNQLHCSNEYWRAMKPIEPYHLQKIMDANLKFPKQRPSSSWLQLEILSVKNRIVETGETMVESSTHPDTWYCPHFSYLRVWRPCSNVIPQFPVTNPLHWTWIQVLEQSTRKGFFLINIPRSFKTSWSGEVSFGRKWNTLVILSYLNNAKPASYYRPLENVCKYFRILESLAIQHHFEYSLH